MNVDNSNLDFSIPFSQESQEVQSSKAVESEIHIEDLSQKKEKPLLESVSEKEVTVQIVKSPSYKIPGIDGMGIFLDPANDEKPDAENTLDAIQKLAAKGLMEGIPAILSRSTLNYALKNKHSGLTIPHISAQYHVYKTSSDNYFVLVPKHVTPEMLRLNHLTLVKEKLTLELFEKSKGFSKSSHPFNELISIFQQTSQTQPRPQLAIYLVGHGLASLSFTAGIPQKLYKDLTTQICSTFKVPACVVVSCEPHSQEPVLKETVLIRVGLPNLTTSADYRFHNFNNLFKEINSSEVIDLVVDEELLPDILSRNCQFDKKTSSIPVIRNPVATPVMIPAKKQNRYVLNYVKALSTHLSNRFKKLTSEENTQEYNEQLKRIEELGTRLARYETGELRPSKPEDISSTREEYNDLIRSIAEKSRQLPQGKLEPLIIPADADEVHLLTPIVPTPIHLKGPSAIYSYAGEQGLHVFTSIDTGEFYAEDESLETFVNSAFLEHKIKGLNEVEDFNEKFAGKTLFLIKELKVGKYVYTNVLIFRDAKRGSALCVYENVNPPLTEENLQHTKVYLGSQTQAIEAGKAVFDLSPSKKVKSLEFSSLLRNFLSQTRPSEKVLLETTGGQQTYGDILRFIQGLFFPQTYTWLQNGGSCKELFEYMMKGTEKEFVLKNIESIFHWSLENNYIGKPLTYELQPNQNQKDNFVLENPLFRPISLTAIEKQIVDQGMPHFGKLEIPSKIGQGVFPYKIEKHREGGTFKYRLVLQSPLARVLNALKPSKQMSEQDFRNALSDQDIDTIKFYLALNPDSPWIDKLFKNKTPLDFALESRNSDLINILIHYGAKKFDQNLFLRLLENSQQGFAEAIHPRMSSILKLMLEKRGSQITLDQIWILAARVGIDSKAFITYFKSKKNSDFKEILLAAMQGRNISLIEKMAREKWLPKTGPVPSFFSNATAVRREFLNEAMKWGSVSVFKILLEHSYINLDEAVDQAMENHQTPLLLHLLSSVKLTDNHLSKVKSYCIKYDSALIYDRLVTMHLIPSIEGATAISEEILRCMTTSKPNLFFYFIGKWNNFIEREKIENREKYVKNQDYFFVEALKQKNQIFLQILLDSSAVSSSEIMQQLLESEVSGNISLTQRPLETSTRYAIASYIENALKEGVSFKSLKYLEIHAILNDSLFTFNHLLRNGYFGTNEVEQFNALAGFLVKILTSPKDFSNQRPQKKLLTHVTNLMCKLTLKFPFDQKLYDSFFEQLYTPSLDEHLFNHFKEKFLSSNKLSLDRFLFSFSSLVKEEFVLDYFKEHKSVFKEILLDRNNKSLILEANRLFAVLCHYPHLVDRKARQTLSDFYKEVKDLPWGEKVGKRVEELLAATKFGLSAQEEEQLSKALKSTSEQPLFE